MLTHFKCCNGTYPLSKVRRLPIPNHLIPWSADYDNYDPPVYNSDVLVGKPWADPLFDSSFLPQWNRLDGNVNRVSHTGCYSVKNGVPLNPFGRTGLSGRGMLGRWGPNHAADPIVTRWKRNITRDIETKMGRKVLQLCVIERVDCGEWALPGGMVDPGEKVSVTLRREFMEEALNSLSFDTDKSAEREDLISQLFSNGTSVYDGYVDDPRNTDNAWMETSAMNYHDELGSGLGALELKAGDDARNVKWMDVDSGLKLYASHNLMVKQVVENFDAYW